MDNKLLLVKSVTLLYRESLLPNKSENSADLVRTVLENIKIAEISITLNKERDTLLALKQTVLEMCENPLTYEYEKGDLLQRLKMNCFGDEELYESILQGIEPEITEASIKRSVVNIKKSISNHFREQQVDAILFKAAGEFRHARDKIKNVPTWISQVVAQLEPFQVTQQINDPAIISTIDIGDVASTASVFKDIKNAEKGQTLLRTGFQQLNKMLQGGFRRGETTVIGALQHKYKTGFSLTLFKQIALYNVPHMRDSTKKPLLLRISFEDDVTLNLQFLYQSLKENETGIKVSVSNVSDEEMAAYIKEKLGVNGYHVHLMRVDPTNWTYMDLCNCVIELESKGYEIHLLMLDYLAMLPTTGCTINGPMGSDVRDMYRRMRNFTSSRGICFLTPHQLSTEAKQLIRDGRQDFVKEIAEKGYWDKCKTIDNEVDLELYIHIEKFNKKAYLTIQRGKHRLPTIIPDEDKYIVYPFNDVGGIVDDIDGENTATKKVGGKTIGNENDGKPDWAFKESEVATI